MLGFDVGVATEHSEIFVSGDSSYFQGIQANLEVATCCFVSKIMKIQVTDSEPLTGPFKGLRNATWENVPDRS